MSFIYGFSTRSLLCTILLSIGSSFNSNAQFNPDTLKAKLARETYDTAKVGILDKLAYFYNYSDPSQALPYITEEMKLAKSIDYMAGIGRSMINMGIYEKQMNNYTISLLYLDSALTYVTNAHDTIAIAMCYNGMAAVHSDLANYEEALQAYQDAMDVFLNKGDELQVATLLSNIGIVHCEQKNIEKGLDYFKRALEIQRKLENPHAIMRSLTNIGITYAELEDYVNAEIYYVECLQIAEELDNIYAKALITLNLGLTYYLAGKINETIPVLLDAEKYSKVINNADNLVTIYSYLAQSYAEHGQYNQALEYALKSKEIADNIGSLLSKSTSMKAFISVYKNQGNYARAFEYQNDLIAVSDSIYTDEQKNRIAELETRFEAKKRENEIALLSKENEIQKTNSEMQQQRIIALIIIVSGLIIILILIIRQLVVIRKANMNLSRKNLELMKAETSNAELGKMVKKYTRVKKDEIIEKLETCINEEKLFTQTKMTIDDCAKKLDTNRTYLSNIINTHYNCNFNTFINRQRIKEARIILADKQFSNYTIEAIGNEVGFASKSVFNDVFKRETGITPSYFQRAALSQ